jgi:hypothetical protein
MLSYAVLVFEIEGQWRCSNKSSPSYAAFSPTMSTTLYSTIEFPREKEGVAQHHGVAPVKSKRCST